MFSVYVLFVVQLTDRDLARHQSARHRPVEEQVVGNYRLIKTIGRGNFAKVKLAKHIPTGQQVDITLQYFVCQPFFCCVGMRS
jgi:hypothetical protein